LFFHVDQKNVEKLQAFFTLKKGREKGEHEKFRKYTAPRFEGFVYLLKKLLNECRLPSKIQTSIFISATPKPHKNKGAEKIKWEEVHGMV